MPESDKTPTNLTATVTIHNDIRDCFYSLDAGINWYPGWAVADIVLPLALYSNRYVLIRDSSGLTHWVAANKVKYRGEIDQFNYHYYESVFDWNKYQKFEPITESFIPSAGIVWRENSNGLGVSENLDF